MPRYEFTLVLTEREDSLDDIDTLYEAGCSDGLISTSGGFTRIDFGCDGPRSIEAIRSAIAGVNKTRFRVARVESDFANIIAKINSELIRTSSF